MFASEFHIIFASRNDNEGWNLRIEEQLPKLKYLTIVWLTSFNSMMLHDQTNSILFLFLQCENAVDVIGGFVR
jgi:hypothetical protein